MEEGGMCEFGQVAKVALLLLSVFQACSHLSSSEIEGAPVELATHLT